MFSLVPEFAATPSQVISFLSDAINVRVKTQGRHICLSSLFRVGINRAGLGAVYLVGKVLKSA